MGWPATEYRPRWKVELQHGPGPFSRERECDWPAAASTSWPLMLVSGG